MLHKMSCATCILCSTSVGDLVPIGKKGIESLKHAAVCRSEKDRCIHFKDGIFVHEKCRTNYVSKVKITRWISKQENTKCVNILKIMKKWKVTQCYSYVTSCQVSVLNHTALYS